MKTVFILCLIINSVSFASDSKEVNTPEAQAVNTACSADAEKAGCGSEKVGTGLLKCLRAYKKSQKNDFKFSDSCKESMKKMRESRKSK